MPLSCSAAGQAQLRHPPSPASTARREHEEAYDNHDQDATL